MPLLLRSKLSGRNIVREEEVAHVLLVCQCCGKEYQTNKPNRSKYCNRTCAQRSIAKTHGKTGSKIHIAWSDMKDRCVNPNNRKYYNYGGRGITVCDSWLSFENFYADVGDPPFPKAHLDRIDNNGNYEPKNVRWVSNQENSQNTRRNIFVEYRGEKMCLAEACRRSGLHFNTIRERSKRKSISVQESFDHYLKAVEYQTSLSLPHADHIASSL